MKSISAYLNITLDGISDESKPIIIESCGKFRILERGNHITYILENVKGWVDKYGTKAAYFCTNDAHTEPLLKKLLEYGGYFIEADLPSPLMGYPGALGIDLTEEAGDFEKILAKVESSIVEAGGAGKFGTWAYSYGYITSAGLAQHAMNVIDGKCELCDMEAIADAYHEYSPKASWNGSNYTNVETGVKSENVFLVYQDTKCGV